MVKGLAFFSWDTRLGATLEMKYPLDLELSDDLINKIYMTHSYEEDFTKEELIEITYENSIILSYCDKSKISDRGYEIFIMILEERENINKYKLKTKFIDFVKATLQRSEENKNTYFIENISTDYGMNFHLRRYQMDRDAERGWSDYWAFVQYGYESIACWGSSDGDPNYHSENDNFDNINFSYLVNTTRHIVGALAYLADFENPNPQIKITNPKKGRLYYKDRIFLDFLYEKTVVLKDVHIYAEVKPGDAEIDKVEFYYDGILGYSDIEIPYEWRLNKTSLWFHTVQVVVYDINGKTSEDQVKFLYLYINRD